MRWLVILLALLLPRPVWAALDCAPPAQISAPHAVGPNDTEPVRLLPQPLLRANICMTPSAQLLQHEWAKHGTCMAATPEAYFAKASAAFAALRFPHVGALAHDRGLTAGALQKAFADTNQGMPPQAFAIMINRAGWLEEVHVCLGLDFHPRGCPAGTGGADAAKAVRIEGGGIESGSPGYRSSRSRDDVDRGGGGSSRG